MSVAAVVSMAAAGVIAAAPLALAGPSGPSAPVATGLAGPSQLKVGRNGSIIIGEEFAGALLRVNGKAVTTLVSGLSEVNGVAYDNHGLIDFTSGAYPLEEGQPVSAIDTGPTQSLLQQVDNRGNVTTLADLGAYERDHNPNAHATYGFLGISANCAKQFPTGEGAPSPLPYKGDVNSHPYAVAVLPGGFKLVADAGGNDLVAVGPRGGISTVAVLPARIVTITSAIAKATGMPHCVVGHKYALEPVPTDIQIRGIDAYVTSLPGGPEDGSLGNNGSVYKVNLLTHRVTLVATGLAGAVNLAISPAGTIFVSELFANRVSKIVNGAPVPVATINQPAGLDFANGKLYVAENMLGNGDVVTLTP